MRRTGLLVLTVGLICVCAAGAVVNCVEIRFGDVSDA